MAQRNQELAELLVVTWLLVGSIHGWFCSFPGICQY